MIPSPKKAVTSQKSRKDTNELMQGLQEAVFLYKIKRDSTKGYDLRLRSILKFEIQLCNQRNKAHSDRLHRALEIILGDPGNSSVNGKATSGQR